VVGGPIPRWLARSAVSGAIALSASLLAEPSAQAKCKGFDQIAVGLSALLAIPPGIATSVLTSGIAHATHTHALDFANGIAWGMLGTAVGAGTGAGVGLAAGCPTVSPLLPVILSVGFATGAVIGAYEASPALTGSASNRLVATRPERATIVRFQLLVIAF
jgi:hypothetical protein